MDAEVKDALGGYFDAVDEGFEILRDRIKALEDRVPETPLQYRGVFQRAEKYQRGDVVTLDGLLHFCTGDTSGLAPGKGGAWQTMTRSTAQ